ncbi:MAG: hypothetical protein U0531_20085 [Dehalococcoidia bacterium]
MAPRRGAQHPAAHEAIFCHEWWWTASCEYADIVFGVDSRAEFRQPDVSGSCTNPFLHVFPVSPLDRIHDTRGDAEVLAGIAKRISDLTGDKRFADHWKFTLEGKMEVYLQRIFNASTSTAGYKVADVHEKAKQGIPTLMNYRTYPPAPGRLGAATESKPWYNRTGRLEFYRDEKEFIEHGENLPVWREPVDLTFYEPNVIMAKPHPQSCRWGRRRTGQPRRPVGGSAPGAQCGDALVGAEADEAPAGGAGLELPLHLPHAEVPPRLPHDTDGCGLDGLSLRPVRRHAPPRQADAGHRRRIRRDPPEGRQGPGHPGR